MGTYYTYILFDPTTRMFYIGSRKSKTKNVYSDNYLGSCKHPEWKNIKNRCKKRILKVFLTKEMVIEHESYLHAKHNVSKNDRYYNSANQTSVKFCYDRSNETLSEDHKLKIRNSKKGKKFGAAILGVNKGKPSPFLNKKAKRVICENCGKDVANNIYVQYHGLKCKYNQ